MQLLKDIFGTDVVNLVMTEAPADWMELMINFERKKRGFNPQEKSAATNVPLPYGFIENYQSTTNKSIKNSIPPRYRDLGVTLANGMLRLPYDVMEGLFKCTVAGIVAHVNMLLLKPALKKVSHILLVGGFGECLYLQLQLKKSLKDKIQLLIPSEASHCVQKGAVLLGYHPVYIIERVSRKTYGIAICVPYNPSIHDSYRITIVDNEARVNSVFSKFVTKGQHIKPSETVVRSFLPVTAQTQATEITIYETDDLDPKYTDDPGVNKVGEMKIALPGYGGDRKIECSMMFGSTEIEVEARDPRPGGDVASVTVDFLSCHTEGY